jgi:Flp pilus assembly protein CpaB
MQAKTIILIVIAVGCGLVATIGISQMVDRKGGEVGGETVKMFVAAVNIDIGDKLDSQNVRLEEWPRDRVPEGTITNLKDLEDRYARQRLFPGEPIMSAKLMEENSSITILIPEGFRVCPIKVQGGHNSIANLINPGDRVDVLVFLRATTGVEFTGTKTFLRNIRVFAVDQKTARDAKDDDAPQNAQIVSLLVTPKQAEKLTLASELGSLRLVLRHPGEKTTGLESRREGTSIQSLFYGDDDDDVTEDETEQPLNQFESSLIDDATDPENPPQKSLLHLLPWYTAKTDSDSSEEGEVVVEHTIYVHGENGVRVFEFQQGQDRPVERIFGEPEQPEDLDEGSFSESSDLNEESDYSDQPEFDDFSTGDDAE